MNVMGKNRRDVILVVLLLLIALIGIVVFLISLNIGVDNNNMDVTMTNTKAPNIEITDDIEEDNIEIILQKEKPKETANNDEDIRVVEKELSDLQTPENFIVNEKENEPPKNSPKTNSDLSDKSNVPSYEEIEINPQEKLPLAGERNNKGEVYFPGFGWIEDDGENITTNVDSEGDINNQVGTMD
ncbi:UNVERIFIED_CONTAM: hypothetical protein Cloal_0222 [Acetivibrio alkalicellulosi]